MGVNPRGGAPLPLPFLRSQASIPLAWWAAAAAAPNPTAWQHANRTLRDRTQFDLGYRSSILSDIASATPDGSLVILTGPRRAGKTVALPDAALRLCGGGGASAGHHRLGAGQHSPGRLQPLARDPCPASCPGGS
jgi:hypothetical protein